MNKFLILSSLLVLNLTTSAAAKKPINETPEKPILRRSNDGKIFFRGMTRISMLDFLLEQPSLKLDCRPKLIKPSVLEFWKDRCDYSLNDTQITKAEYELAQKIEAAKKINFSLMIATDDKETPVDIIVKLRKELDKALRSIK